MPKKFNEDFKNTIVELYKSGKRPSELAREYGISVQSIYLWLGKQEDNATNNDNISIEEVIVLRKENARLKDENEILKKVTHHFTKRN